MKSLISKVLNKIVFILIKLNIIKPKSIFYMGGVNILPPPLSAEEEMELLQQLETDDSIKQILIERNLRLVVYISRKFENTGIDIEDLISIGTIGLIKAVNTFKLNKNINLREELIRRGIIIRSCSNYIGLDHSFYRVAVRTREENKKLLEELSKVLK